VGASAIFRCFRGLNFGLYRAGSGISCLPLTVTRKCLEAVASLDGSLQTLHRLQLAWELTNGWGSSREFRLYSWVPLSFLVITSLNRNSFFTNVVADGRFENTLCCMAFHPIGFAKLLNTFQIFWRVHSICGFAGQILTMDGRRNFFSLRIFTKQSKIKHFNNLYLEIFCVYYLATFIFKTVAFSWMWAGVEKFGSWLQRWLFQALSFKRRSTVASLGGGKFLACPLRHNFYDLSTLLHFSQKTWFRRVVNRVRRATCLNGIRSRPCKATIASILKFWMQQNEFYFYLLVLGKGNNTGTALIEELSITRLCNEALHFQPEVRRNCLSCQICKRRWKLLRFSLIIWNWKCRTI